MLAHVKESCKKGGVKRKRTATDAEDPSELTKKAQKLEMNAQVMETKRQRLPAEDLELKQMLNATVIRYTVSVERKDVWNC